ncbi:MAG: HlyD family efflux transporter periplasmic adaptor subunit [Gemmataceae bacterium]|nr:HlyD family efflux transporter periplasmic adaptor subunit [Gemmataceae bacterium]
MRVRPLLLSALFALPAAALVAGCNNDPGRPNGPAASAAESIDVDVGPSLYPAKPDVVIPPAPAGAVEPLVIPNSVISYEERQQVGAEVDGKIELLAVRDDAIDPGNPNCVYHPRDQAPVKAKYRLLKEGDGVKSGQVLCWLDDQVVTTQMRAAREQMAAADEVEKAADQGVDLTNQKLEMTRIAGKAGGTSSSEVLQDMITKTRFVENAANARQSKAKSKADFDLAGVNLGKHRVASSVNGIVRTINRRGGEFVKAGERILEIQATDTVRLEGNLDIQYAGFLKRGMPVEVEPARTFAPYKTAYLHRQEVTGVAVTADPARPLVVTAGADGTARVYDVLKGAALGNLPHPDRVPVRSVACSPADARPVLAVTGGDDGKVRVWDLSNPDRLPAEPKVLADTHAAAVGAVAFSPDGKYFATAAGRDVFVWAAADGKKLYALPADHRDAVTSLHFTPQGTLVTASKDRSLKVWKLGAEKAGLARTIDHRAGAIDHVGVTKDGGRVVFDQDKNRLDLVGLADRQTAGSVQNPGPTTVFGTLALFNRDDSLLATAGGEGELKGGLQVWTVPPAGGRGTEAARLFTPGRVGVTAAAFSPVAEHPFLVVGTEKGTIHLWGPPPDARQKYTGKVVNVDATDPRFVTVRVEMDNRGLKLLDRSVATVIVNPAE